MERDQLAAAVPPARQHEMEVRLAVRTAEERVAALAGPGRALMPQAARGARRPERAAAERRRAPGPAARRSPRRSSPGAPSSPGPRRASRWSRRPSGATRSPQARIGREAELAEVRGGDRELAAELERLTAAVHRDEVARAEQRMRIEQLEATARRRSSASTPTR